MKKTVLSIRYENSLSLVSAIKNVSTISFITPHKNIFILLFLVKYNLLKEKFKRTTSILDSEYNI